MSTSFDLLIVLFQTQEAGTVRYAYAFRHYDPRQCVVGSIAFYLYLRFDVGKESWPEFGSANMEWHSIKLLRQRNDPSKQLGYAAQLKIIKEIFQRFNIQADGFTHAGRKAAVQHGEVIGVEDAQIRQLGHWDSTRMAKHYSSGIARGAARQFAGFPAERGKYYLARSALRPPESLRRKVFPQLEESLLVLNSIPSEERDRAAGSVLNALNWFRTVILEDAVALKDQSQFRESPLFKHSLFQDSEFLNYQHSALLASREDHIPMAIQIQQLVPDIARELHSVTEVMSGQLTWVSKNIDHVEQKVVAIINNQKLHDQRFIAIEQFADKMNRGQIRVISHLQTDTNGDVADDTSQSLIAPPPLIFPPSTAPSHQTVVNPSGSLHTQESIPEYKVNISINSVDKAWEEWDEGLVNGPEGMRSPSIQYLEEKFGAKWRRGDAARKRYTRRKALIQRIKKAAAGLKLPESDVAHRIELWRKAKGMTIDAIQKMLQSCKDSSEPWGQSDSQLLHIH